MYLYILLIAWSIISGVIFYIKDLPSNKKIYLLANMIPITLLTAFRGSDVGRDTEMYIERYFILSDFDFSTFINIFDYDSRTEYGFALLAKLCSIISPSSHILLFLTISIITYYGIGKFYYRLSPNLWLTLMFYFMSLMAFSPMTTMRQEAAVAVSMSFFPYLLCRGKKSLLYALGVAIGSSLHSVAWVLLFPYFIRPKEDAGYTKVSRIVAICILIVVGMLFFYNYFFDFINLFSVYATYSDSKFVDGSIKNSVSNATMLARNFFMYIIPFIGIMYGIKRKIYNGDVAKIAYYSCFFLLLTCLFNVIGYKITIFFRIAMVFDYFTNIALPVFLMIFGRRFFVGKYLYTCLWIIYCITRLYVQFKGNFLMDYYIYEG